jgi:glycosyltransferase involved in cell wall biosynthesis
MAVAAERSPLVDPGASAFKGDGNPEMNRILYIQYTNPGGYPPLQHSSKILAGLGWEALFLGTGAVGAGKLDFPPHPRLTVRRMPYCQAGWRQKLHFLRFCLWVVWTTLTWRPEWVYASDPLSCPAALILTFVPGLQVVYHEHDCPPPKAPGSLFGAFVSHTRKSVARRAAMCVVPNAARLARFQAESGPLRAASCVWNCPGSYEIPVQPREAPHATTWLLYHGSIVPDRLPLAVIDALGLLPDSVCLRIVGYETIGSRGYVAALESHARSLNIQDRVEVLGPVARAELLKITAKSDVGLAFMPMSSSDGNFISMTGASNKAFDYLACGLALVVSELPDWREMFVDPGYALACNPADPSSIAAAIRRLIDDPAGMRAMGESGRQRILAEWNYETAFRPVLARLSAESPGGIPMCETGESRATTRLL